MPTTVDRQEDLLRALGRLGVGVLELVTSIRDELVVLDRERRVVAVLGDRPDGSPRPENQLGKASREMFAPQAAVHEAAQLRALRGDHVSYEWTRRIGRHPVRLSTTASPLRDSSSDIVGIVLITRSITPVRRDENRFDASTAEKTKRLLELEEGVQQLGNAIDNYRKTWQTPLEFRADSALNQLSSRERQVLDLLGQGYRPRSIAEKLHVSPETVRNHLKAMFRKTGTHSQEELTAMLRAAD